MTGFWGVLGEGSSGDSLLIRQSADQFSMNRRCFLPPFLPYIHCHPERIHLSHLQ
jgi:hypothetical protein